MSFEKRLASPQSIVQSESPTNHMCTFFIPVDKKSQSLFLVYHKKANDWIPPGGHFEKGETPLSTISREFKEELRYQLTNEPITLFDISTKRMNSIKYPCKYHYDFWYMVWVHKKDNYSILKKEFYDGKWFHISDAVKMTKNKSQKEITQKLPLIFKE